MTLGPCHNGPVSRTPVQSAAARRGRPSYDRDSLLEVAVVVFNERGYDGTSMEELARRLGLSKSTSTTMSPARRNCSTSPSAAP